MMREIDPAQPLLHIDATREAVGAHSRELAVLCDLREENWPSMDLVADKLLLNLASQSSRFRATRVCPPMKVRFAKLPAWGARRAMLNADRLLNRMYDYPAFLRPLAARFEVFHVCDHSYAQLVHELPVGRTGVFCHDLDTFRCLLEPEKEPRPAWFKAMANRVMRGLRRAAVVFHSTSAVREQICRYGLVDDSRLVHAPYGIAEDFRPTRDAETDRFAEGLLQPGGAPFLLHVGSCIPRKRIDVLLDVFSEVRRRQPGLWLLQVGGEWSLEQKKQIARRDIAAVVVQVPRLPQASVAALYRRAALVLMPSESEGFGLPVVEALACGGVVVASDIPVFREVGGPGAAYCPMGDVEAWASLIEGILLAQVGVPDVRVRLEWTRQFSWSEHARRIAEAYEVHCPR